MRKMSALLNLFAHLTPSTQVFISFAGELFSLRKSNENNQSSPEKNFVKGRKINFSGKRN
jgi:hypothetical protein